MSGANTFGRSFCVTTFGESHGPAIGCVIDGCPPGIAIDAEDFRHDLERRATGRSRFTSQRRETDAVEILSGVYQGRSTGTPIALLIRNTDARSKDYGDIALSFRPGHADYTYWHKYGIRDPRGGGRSSARETTMRVAAAVIAKRYLAEQHGIAIQAWLSGIGPYVPRRIERASVEDNPLFWPDPDQLPEIEAYLDGLRKSGDSIGARLSVIAENVPVGLGEPIYGKLDSDIAMALMSINAVKAVEIGDGVAVCSQRGSEHRDELSADGFRSNRAGGILGGISSGQNILAHAAIKPTSSILVPGQTLNTAGEASELVTRGRHDPCVGIRAVPIMEAMLALVLMDHVLRHRAQCGGVPPQTPLIPADPFNPETH
ncbi:MAG: chorismate synthase [Lysobacterales bacterium]|nr:chorismate synthase [Xanthomonadales bacterium]